MKLHQNAGHAVIVGIAFWIVGLALYKPYLPVFPPGTDEGVWLTPPNNTFAETFVFSGAAQLGLASVLAIAALLRWARDRGRKHSA